MIDTNDVSDEEFMAAARALKQEKENRENRKPSNFVNRVYEDIQWTDIPKGQSSVFRFIGRVPNIDGVVPTSTPKPYDPLVFISARAMSDEGVEVKFRLPKREQDSSKNHIMWRIIDAVKKVEYRDDPNVPGKKIKARMYEGQPWFNRVVHGGYDPTSKSYTYAKGWSGQEVVVANVIDRNDDWCKQNNHTKLLCKDINVSEYVDKEGKNVTRSFPSVGVPTYGFLDKIIIDICGPYGKWYNYDIMITKTGDKQAPYSVKNASRFKDKEMFEELGDAVDKVVVGPLTSQEVTYDTYDIQKMFAPTTYNKLLKYFGTTIKNIDAALNRHYYEELLGMVEKEKAMFQEMYGTNSEGNTSTETVPNSTTTNTSTFTNTVSTTPSAPSTPLTQESVVAPTSTESKLDSYKISLLKGWDKLTPSEKAQIVDVKLFPDGSINEVVFTSTSAPLVDCPTSMNGCGKASPSDFMTCPCCAASFNGV